MSHCRCSERCHVSSARRAMLLVPVSDPQHVSRPRRSGRHESLCDHLSYILCAIAVVLMLSVRCRFQYGAQSIAVEADRQGKLTCTCGYRV